LSSELLAPIHSDAAGFVLAGGQSTRMGRDKALVPFAGRPLIEHTLATLREAGLPASIAGGQPALAACAPLIPDAHPALGPLSGICAALASTSAPLAVFVPVDLPLLPASLLQYLLRHAQLSGDPITLASVNGFAQTFPVVLDCSITPLLENQLHTSQRGCFAAFQAAAEALNQSIGIVPVEHLVQAGQVVHPRGLPACRWFLNLNREADLRLAEPHARPLIA
jgi:molybdopterin-guanine dinucleotide biosynthesis protein A